MTWDPTRYLTYADERGRAFVDLVARIDATAPATVVDLGCGPGHLTGLLKQRWPDADVLGVDSSPEMVAAASAPGVRFEVGSIEDWQGSADVVVSNAALQWVPGHLDLLPRLADLARQWFAFQVPGNFEAPTHAILRELLADPRYSSYAEGLARPSAHDPATYLDVLRAAGWSVDAWETTYLHELVGEHPVFTWVSATAARPVLAALPTGLREEFVADYQQRLAAAYPVVDGRAVLAFRRVFVVSSRA